MADTVPITSSSPTSENAKCFQLVSCRKCSDRFLYKLSSTDFVEIIVGIPLRGLAYKAISHVWGPHFAIEVYCQSCSSVHSIRVRSKATFENVLWLAGPGSRIWIDSLSIDQNDHSDVAAQIAVMGNIYGRAQCVSVLLPPSDRAAYEHIGELLTIAKILLDRKGQFDFNYKDSESGAGPSDGIVETGKLAKRFVNLSENFRTE